MLFRSLASGGTPGYNYQWNPGGTQSAIWVSPLISSTYLLSATDANSCSVTSPIVVNIIPCGALEWFIPNVFSPNADGVNDVFGISSINGLSQQAMIVNRWGDIMIELNQINQFWDGTTPDGKEAKEGVYFMKYSILGPAGEEQSGHVFFHLLRND